MILREHPKKEVIKFCEIRGIPINGKISNKEVREVQDFIKDRMKKDRAITRRLEYDEKFHIKTIIKDMIKLEGPTITIEDYMKDALIKADLFKDCVPQYKIGTKRVDFAFPNSKLAVECDGREYHFTEAWQIERDQKRDKYLARKGWRVLHIEGVAIRSNIELCVEKIQEAL